MRSTLRAFAPGTLLLLAAGCVATQSDVLQLSQQTDNLTLQIQGLKKTLGNLQTNQADLAVKLDQVHSEFNALNENLKDNREGMSRLSGKLDDLNASLSSKVSSLDESLTQQKKFIEAAEESRRAAEEGRRKAAEQAAAAAPPVSGKSALSPTEVYSSAKRQLTQKKYDLAIQGFKLYLEKYPKGESVEGATYYLAQAYFAKKEWEPAARQYAVLIDRYPKSEHTPGARLRYAACLMDLKTHLDEAKRYLESIPEDFPKSPEASKAAAILKDFDAKFPAAKKSPPSK